MTYILAESDFKIIAFMNTIALGAFAAASFAFSIFLTFLASWLYTPEMTPELELLTVVVIWFFLGISVIGAILGVVSIKKKKTHISDIKKETETL